MAIVGVDGQGWGSLRSWVLHGASSDLPYFSPIEALDPAWKMNTEILILLRHFGIQEKKCMWGAEEFNDYEQITKKPNAYSCEGGGRVEWEDAKSFKGMVIFTRGWMKVVWRQICKEKPTSLWALRRMSTFLPSGLLGNWVFRRKAKFSDIQKKNWTLKNICLYLCSLRSLCQVQWSIMIQR